MYRFLLVCVAFGLSCAGAAAQVRNSYATQDGRSATVVVTCPSADASFTAVPCTAPPQSPVTYAAPAAAAIVTANVAVTVFAAGAVLHSCDIVNTGTDTLYVDFTTTAVAGSATSIPLQAGQGYHCAFPPVGAVSAVADMAQPFVAVKY